MRPIYVIRYKGADCDGIVRYHAETWTHACRFMKNLLINGFEILSVESQL